MNFALSALAIKIHYMTAKAFARCRIQEKQIIDSPRTNQKATQKTKSGCRELLSTLRFQK
jgi:hypothetical protein